MRLDPSDHANLAYQAGSVYGGLIFARQSKRKVNVEEARLIMSGAPLHYVGVFQNQPMDEVAQTAHQLGLAAVQLHGNESQAEVTQLRALLPKTVKIWKAYGVSDTLPSLLDKHIDKHLLDSQVGQQSGGTGVSFDWTLLDKGKTSTAHRQNIMLAGGLSPDNIAQASQLGCIGLDLNSGVESEPGIKDAGKLQAAFEALRNY